MGGDRAEARQHAADVKRRNAYRGGLEVGQLALRDKEVAPAAAEFQALVRQYPDSVAPHVALAGVYDQQGRPEAHWELVESLARRRGGDPLVHFYLGRAGAISGGEPQRSEEVLRRYLQHTPSATEPPLWAARWRLGMVYEKQGRTEQAPQEY